MLHNKAAAPQAAGVYRAVQQKTKLSLKLAEGAPNAPCACAGRAGHPSQRLEQPRAATCHSAFRAEAQIGQSCVWFTLLCWFYRRQGSCCSAATAGGLQCPLFPPERASSPPARWLLQLSGGTLCFQPPPVRCRPGVSLFNFPLFDL